MTLMMDWGQKQNYFSVFRLSKSLGQLIKKSLIEKSQKNYTFYLLRWSPPKQSRQIRRAQQISNLEFGKSALQQSEHRPIPIGLNRSPL